MSDVRKRSVERLLRDWEAADRKRGVDFLRERRERHEAFWKLTDGSLEAVHARLNDPRRFPTPQTTIEAIMYCVGERGLAALEVRKVQGWLSDCDVRAREQINERIERLRGARRLPNEQSNA